MSTISAPREILISSEYSDLSAVKDIWNFRELLWSLTWRNIHVRYKQAVIGVLWVLIRPLLMAVTYTVIFGFVAQLPSIGGIPYSVMVLSGLVIWTFFSQAISACSMSFLIDAPIITKVYLPRLLIPLSHALAGIVDFLVTLVFLLGMMWWRHVPLTSAAWAMPLAILFMIFVSFGIGLLLGATMITFRDVQHLTPFFLQLGFYAAPIAYSSSVVPERYRWIYYLNPLAGSVDGLRWSLLGQTVNWAYLTESFGVGALIFVAAVLVFRKIEPVMIDQI